MRIVEILLPKGANDRSLSPKHIQKIDALQRRMDGYVDRIFNPSTTDAGREFLKSKLRDDYHELKELIPHIHQVAEDDPFPTPRLERYEVYDRQTGKVVAGPYSSRVRATRVVDKKDNEYGGYRYAYRKVESLTEAVHKLPLTSDDFELVKKLMERPIPAGIASIYISEVIDDDMLNGELESVAEIDPGRDIRQMIVDWIDRVMPDQKHRFGYGKENKDQKKGVFSVLHGYDPHEYARGGDTGTAPGSEDAYGMR